MATAHLHDTDNAKVKELEKKGIERCSADDDIHALSQPSEFGGFGFGTIVTSVIFLTCIAVVVFYMTITRNGEEALAEAGA
jgi:hypothetical protein